MSEQPLQNLELRQLDRSDIPAVTALIREGKAAGELSNYANADFERMVEGLGDEPEKTTIAIIDGETVGFLAQSWDVLFVAAAWRRQKVGTQLVNYALSRDPELELSPDRENPTTKDFLASVGFSFDHLMHQMKRPADLELGEIVIPDGFSLRTYQHEDFDPYFALWNRAFRDHPTPLQVTEARVRAVHARESFDPTRIALIARGEDRNDLVGFITTRSLVEENGETIGPIGAICTYRSVRRLGLGRTLLRWGIQRLKQDGAGPITLEVVTLNERALPLYESEGFVPTQSWEFWTHKG
ncbi:hypothetical protein BH09CHL1_BH09CHL1_23320 [soil metagenome]